MKKYIVKIELEVLTDIQEIADWYNEQQAGIGTRFQKKTIKQIDSFNKNSHIFAIRYKQIRCIPIKNYPYMIHFYINEKTKTIEVLAVISTDKNPKIWLEKT